MTPEIDLSPWIAAQAAQAPALARAAREVGRLEATLAALTPAEAQGAHQRLALSEVEAMLWAQGIILRRDEIGRDLMAARADADPEAMRLARWAVRRLDGQGAQTDLAAFLGLQRRAAGEPPQIAGLNLRVQGDAFAAAAAGFLARVSALADLDPLARGPLVAVLWRVAGLSPPEQLVEPAIWAARHMAQDSDGLRFVVLGRHGRRVWPGIGTAADRLAAHLRAVASGAHEGRAMIRRIAAWGTRARAATAAVKGDNAARVIAVLAARPLVSALEAEAQAGVSRPTAERMLRRLSDLGLIREVTGHRRFRLWTAAA